MTLYPILCRVKNNNMREKLNVPIEIKFYREMKMRESGGTFGT